MIRATFYIRNNEPCGFVIDGHSGYAECGQDIICAAVSSAAYMAVNTVTEILGIDIDADVNDGYMKIMLSSTSKAATDMLKGLQLHLTELAKDNPDFIEITTEV
ncbi:MAG: ribosomal-processing cysteine protease Prp [Clostridia bacterium]|nr:ribosomal-processing cysteine protease Prp [Clostridia bacterium]